MRLAISMLLGGLLFLSSQVFADDVRTSDIQSNLVPESCSLKPDSHQCSLDKDNIKLLHHLRAFFSEKKGNSIVFTAEHFEELLSKMRSLLLTRDELIAFENNPQVCIDKLQPIVEHIAKYAEMEINEDLVISACKKLSALCQYGEKISELSKSTQNHSLLTMGLGLVIMATTLGTCESRSISSALVLSVGIVAFIGGALGTVGLLNSSRQEVRSWEQPKVQNKSV